MKILQINSVYGEGSTGRIVQNLHYAIQKAGHVSYVIYGRGNNSNEENVFRIGNLFEQAVDLIGTRILNRHSQFNFITTNLIIKKIESLKPDIVHLHNIHGYYINFFTLINYLRKSNIKVVWLLHDTWLISGSSATKGGLDYDWEGKPNYEMLKNISKDYPKHLSISAKQSISNYRLKKEVLSDSNFTFVTPSNWLSSIVKNSYLKNNKIITIYNGIDTEKFNLIDNYNQENQFNILGVANIWDPLKGVKLFEQLAKDLNDSYSITLVGAIKTNKNQLHSRIKHIERTQSINELVQYYNQADVFVNPTLYDNFPTVNLEAQACGLPVITFDTGGSAESIIDGKTGKIVPTNNYDILLREILKWPNKSKKIEKITRNNALKYSLNSMFNQYLDLYTEILR